MKVLKYDKNGREKVFILESGLDYASYELCKANSKNETGVYARMHNNPGGPNKTKMAVYGKIELKYLVEFQAYCVFQELEQKKEREKLQAVQ